MDTMEEKKRKSRTIFSEVYQNGDANQFGILGLEIERQFDFDTENRRAKSKAEGETSPKFSASCSGAFPSDPFPDLQKTSGHPPQTIQPGKDPGKCRKRAERKDAWRRASIDSGGRHAAGARFDRRRGCVDAPPPRGGETSFAGGGGADAEPRFVLAPLADQVIR